MNEEALKKKFNVWKVLKTVVESTFKDADNLVKTVRESVQIRSFFWSVFSCIRTEYGNLRSNLFNIISRSFKKKSFDY